MFYALPNLRAQTTFEMEKPWEEWSSYPLPEDTITDKQAREKWLSAPKTKHALVSGLAGIDARVRIMQGSKKSEMANPPKVMHAFIADYDANCTDVLVANITEKPASTYLPNYVLDSGTSGRKRLVWLFERPLLLAGTYAAGANFVRKLAAEIRAKDWLPGYDEKSAEPNRYFAIGSNWEEVQPMPIPYPTISMWAIQSDAQTHFTSNTLSPPPIEQIAELVSDRFPGRWSGEFALGGQGIRFWDPSADNPRAAVVMAEGMRCFTGQSGFVTWEEIFGKREIDELRGEQQGQLRDRVVWVQDTAKYWVNVHPDGGHDWTCYSKEDFRSYLQYIGLDDRKPRGGGMSRLERFRTEVTLTQKVKEALPFVFQPPGKFPYMGEPYLNTCFVTVMPPGPPLFAPEDDFHSAGQKAFPWFHTFLTNLFAPSRAILPYVPKNVPDKEVQMWHFLAWWHRFYKGGFNHKPLQGQAIVIGGPPNRGKGLLTSGWIAKSVGGAADGSSYLVADDQWTSEVLQKPLITVDDDTSGDDLSSHRKFNTKLKRMVANAQQLYNKKFGSAGRVEWNGRVTITCNLDPESLRILPDMTQSNADKIMLFLAGEGVDLPDKHTLSDIMARELPMFLRWLLDWEVPKWLLAGDDRFWVRSYHHPTLLEASAEHGVAVNVLEMLREVCDNFRESNDITANERGVIVRVEPDKGKVYEWTGPVRSLHRMMRQLSVAQVDRFTTQQMASMLGVLSSRGFNVTKVSSQDWRIVFDEALMTGKVTDNIVVSGAKADE